MEWIRRNHITQQYPISKAYAYQLIHDFMADPEQEKNWIKDGKVLLVKKIEFEEWWRQRGSQR